MITLIETLGYKCLKRVWVPLSNFQILVGPNASGKSAFLDTIALLGDLLEHGVDFAMEKRSQSFNDLAWMGERDWFAVAVEIELPQRLFSLMKEKHEERSFSHCRYEVVLGLSRESGVEVRHETLWLKPAEPASFLPGARDDMQLRLFRGGAELPEEFSGRKSTPSGWRKTINKTRTQDYFISEITRWNAPFRFGSKRMALANVPEEDVPEKEARFPVSAWAKRLLRDGIVVLSLKSDAMRRPCSPLRSATFETDGGNLPLVVRRLRKDNEARFQGWLRHLQTALPDLVDVTIVERPEDRHLYLNVHYANGLRAPSWTISDGTLRMMALTLLAYLPESERVFLIEEPENGIHPKAIETVFQSLSSAYDNQILVATHSPVMLSVAEPSQVICFGKDKEGATRLIPGNLHPGLKSWQGTENLGVLYAAGVLG